jgi:hypothetical protein
VRMRKAAPALSGLVLALGVLAGCAGLRASEQDPDFAQRFTHRGQDETTQARLEGDRLYGATIEVSKVAPDTYAGRLHGVPTDLRTVPGKITGSVGNLPTDLNVSSSGDALRLQGIFAGAIGTIDVTPRFIRGKIGQCSYAMTREPSSPWYVGKSVCGAKGLQFSDVALPRDLDARPLEDRAALVAMFLGSSR